MKKINKSAVLTAASVAGTVLHAYLIRKAASKESVIREEDTLEKKELLKKVLPLYIPATVVGVGVIGSILWNANVNRKTIAGLTTSVVALERGYRKYKNDIKQMVGGKLFHSEAIKNQSREKYNSVPLNLDDEILFYEEHLGYFTTSMSKIMEAYSYLNQRINTTDFEGESLKSATLNIFLEDAAGKPLSDDINRNKSWGWTLEYLLAMHDVNWVHMDLCEDVMDDGTPYYLILWDEEPIMDPGHYGEYMDKELETQHSNFKKINMLDNKPY